MSIFKDFIMEIDTTFKTHYNIQKNCAQLR